ncbi:MAG: TVP38/TMEM64 family protein [Oscillospiraceae bacterium]|nr:TVP38/TMEM64 family protein [Oscillospiraceae bacterium]
MDPVNTRENRLLSWLARLLPLLCMGGLLLWYLKTGHKLTLEDLLHYTPAQPLLAVFFVWLAFALKSLSLVFPVLLLFAVSGRLFPLPMALLVNVVGIAITLSVPYWIGRTAGRDLTQTLQKKHPRLSELRELRHRNNFFFSFLVRAIGILACDVVSLYFGNTRMPFVPYLLGGVLGFLPELVCATVAGMQMSDLHSPWFYITVAVNFLICGLSYLLYRAYRRRTLTQKDAQ